MHRQDEWIGFDCADYCASPLASSGWRDAVGDMWYIEPAARAYVDASIAMLVIGRPGVDGLVWGYRRSQSGIWVYYPIDGCFRRIAETVAELRDGYSAGSIVV